MFTNTGAFRNISVVPSVRNIKWSHTHWGIQHNCIEIKNSWVWSPREQQPAEKVTHEWAVGEDTQTELPWDIEGRHNVMKDEELSKEQSPWGG